MRSTDTRLAGGFNNRKYKASIPAAPGNDHSKRNGIHKKRKIPGKSETTRPGKTGIFHQIRPIFRQRQYREFAKNKIA